MSQQEEAAGKSEIKPRPGRGGRDLREKKMENNCVACSKDKKRGVPPKTRWKEEQKEKARSQEAQGEENRAMAMSSPGKATVAPVAEGSEPQRALKEVQKDAGSSKGENTQTPVACVAGVPRGPVSTGEMVRVTPSESSSGSSRGILYEINQQYLRSKCKFKEGAPLKEYLRQRVPNLGETCTLWEVLTGLKEIIRDNLLFDESNPAMIVGDAPLEAALRKKRVHVNEIPGVGQQQLTMLEASQGPLSARKLSGGTMYEGTAPGNPRPEARAATAQANTTNARVLSLTKIAAGPVVLYSPAPGDLQIIGTVSYTPPQQGSIASALPRTVAGQNGGGSPAATTPAASNFTGVRVRPLNRMPGAARGPGLSREAAASISQVIVTLTLLLANAGPTTGFLAYSCDNMRSPVTGYELAPQEGCWVKQPAYMTPEPKDGRIVWMRDGVGFPVTHCKMTETMMQADCDSGGRVKPWRMISMEKLILISPRSCMEISTSRKVTLFNRTIVLAENGTAMETLEKQVNCGMKGQRPSGGSPGTPGKAYTRLTVRRITVWERAATESLTKRTIAKGSNDIIPNYVAGGMDATEGTFVRNYTIRNCPEEELEELYKGKLGVLDGCVVTLDKTSDGQKAWLRLERGVTICGRRMRRTHLPHVYVKWDGHQRMQGMVKRYVAPLEERELESMRLEWSYLRGCDDYMLRRDIQDITTNGCWTKGILMDLRQSQAAGREGPGSVARLFGVGHLALRSGGVISAARCRMVVVELRNHTTCIQEIPVTYQGKEVSVEPLSLVVQRSATPVKCRKKIPPRWKIGKEWICGYPEIRSCNGPGPLQGTNIQKGWRQKEPWNLTPWEKQAKPDQRQTEVERQPRRCWRHSPQASAVTGWGVTKTWDSCWESSAAVMSVIVVEMVTSTIVRMAVLYTKRGTGLWMMAAFWGTAFQIIVMPSRWALEWG